MKKSDYEVKKSTRKNKKYMARLKNSNDKWTHFGNPLYQQWRDSTPLKLYSHLDHNDSKRRKAFKTRFEKTRHNVGSASFFSDIFLW